MFPVNPTRHIMTIRPLHFLTALLAALALSACPVSGDDDDSSTDDDDVADDDDTVADDDDTVADDDDSAGDDDDSVADDDDSAGDDDDSAGDDDDSTAAVFAPTPGLFEYGLIYFSLNDCNATQSVVGTGATLTALNPTSETFTWDYTVDGDADASCFYAANGDFVCNNTVTSSNLSPIGIQATIGITTTAQGTFTSPTVAEFAISKSLTCSGSQCWVAASSFGVSTFPCTATFTTTAENAE